MSGLATWWREEDRGQILGYRVRWGHKWGHLAQVKDDGPGALGIRAICGGVRGMVLINSRLNIRDEVACTEWKKGIVWLKPGGNPADIIRPSAICPKCKTEYDKRHPTEGNSR